jgi:hypothetical protein
MKNKLVYLLVVAYCINANLSSQELNVFINAFDSETTVWTYLYSTHCSIPLTIHKTVLHGDTVIDGTNWKIITGEPMIEKGLIRTFENKVLFKPYPGYDGVVSWDDKNWNRKDSIAIYDFSLEAGDSIIVRGIKMRIFETDSIVLNDGNKRKQMKYGMDHWHDWESYIEGLGSDIYSPLQMIYSISTCQNDAILVCCHVNDELLYINPSFIDCDGTVTGNELIDSNKIRIILEHNVLNVVYQERNTFDVYLYGSNGILLKQQKNNADKARLYLSDFSKGIYIVRVTSGNKSYSQKIIY